MKILTADQIKETDAYTIHNEPIASIDLMERAAKAFVNWFVSRFGKNKPVTIFCGKGNNGGDGLATARLLLALGYTVKTYVIESQARGSEDYTTNLNRLSKITLVHKITDKNTIPDLDENGYIIDAIFGSGLSRPITGIYAEAIQAINNATAQVIAIDISSGLFCDAPSSPPFIVQADHTVSFQVPKLAFMMPENDVYVGQFHIVPIGLDQDYITQLNSPFQFSEKEFICPMLQTRLKNAHKGNFGKILLMTGSYGKMGAAILSGKAAMRTGTGLLTIHIPKCGHEIIQIAIPEAMASVDEGGHYISNLPELDKYNAIGIGPGLDKHNNTKAVLNSLLSQYRSPIVLDADALNLLSENRHLLEMIPPQSILTPHLKEFERLAGLFNNSYERLALQRSFSKQYQVYIVLKGAHTSISTPDGLVYFNSTGNPGMATAGSGDVLTGIITSLLGQGYPPLQAALIGVYLHGLAGDKAAKKTAQEALIASDIIASLAEAFKILKY